MQKIVFYNRFEFEKFSELQVLLFETKKINTMRDKAKIPKAI